MNSFYYENAYGVKKRKYIYDTHIKFGEKDYKLLFSRMIKYSPSVSCDINNITEINTIVKACSVKITTTTKVKDTCINKPPLPTDLFDFINTPISCMTTTDIDDVEGSNSYSLRDIAKCSTLPYENIPPSGLLGDENNTHVSRVTEVSCHLVAPFILNIHIHPFGIINPKNHCYMNYVIQLLFTIPRTISHNFQFNSSTDGSISKCLFEIARSASSSTDVDALKFRLVQYAKFYSGKQQEDASECLMMLIELINKGSVPYCGSNDNNSIGVSLCEILFSVMLEKYIVCDACGLRSPSFQSSSVLYITPTCTFSMQELIKQGMEQKMEKSCFRCKKNTWHVESNYILQPPAYLTIALNRFRYVNNNFTKDRCSIPMDMTVVLGLHKFSLQATIDHGPPMYSGHYTASINYCKRTFYCNDSKFTEFEMIDTKNSSTAYVVMYKLIT